jgi:hypothetical protein
LSTLVDNIIEGHRPDGNWALIVKDHNYRIMHSKFRGFPIYNKDNVLTNLNLTGFSSVGNQEKIKLENVTLSVSEVTHKTKNQLANNCLSLYETFNEPLEIHVTGGMDTTAIIAVCEAENIPYKLHMKPFKEYFKTLQEASGTVSEYTSPLIEYCRKNYDFCRYASIYHDRRLTSGYMGDGVFCRTIWQLADVANYLGKTLKDVVKETDYSYSYLRRGSNNYLFFRKQELIDIKNHLLEFHSTSDLMWHIDNTYYMSPFMCSKIYGTVLSLSIDDILEVGPDALIQKDIIKDACPDLLLLLDKQKNTLDSTRNFYENIEKVNLKACVEKIILV